MTSMASLRKASKYGYEYAKARGRELNLRGREEGSEIKKPQQDGDGHEFKIVLIINQDEHFMSKFRETFPMESLNMPTWL